MNCTTEAKRPQDEPSLEKTASLTSFDTKKLSRSGRRKAQPEEEAAILSRATTQATVAARSILASGGTKATALSTAKAAAESILIPSDTGNVKVFLSKRKAKQQVSVIASMALMSASAYLTKRPPSNSGKIAMSFMQSPTSSKSTSRGGHQPPSVVQEPARRDDEPSSLGIGSSGSSFADDFPNRRRSKANQNHGSINPKYSSYSQQEESWSEQRRPSKMDYYRTKREVDYECETPTSAGSRSTENLANENPNEDPIYSFSGSSYSERKVEEKRSKQHKPERPFTCLRPQRPLSCDSSVSSNGERKPNKRRDKELLSYTSSEDYYHNSVQETLSHESLGSDVERQNNSDAFVMLTNALSCNAPMCHRGKRKGAVINHLDCRDDTTPSDKKSDRSETEERREEETSGVESGGSCEEPRAEKSYSKRDVAIKSRSVEKEGDLALALRKLNQMSEDEAEERRKRRVELKNKFQESMEQVVLRALATGELSPRSAASGSSPSFIKKSSPPPPSKSGKIDRISQSRNDSPLHFFPDGRDNNDVSDEAEDSQPVMENRGPIANNTTSGTVPDLSRSGTNVIGGGDSSDDMYRICSSRSSNPLTRGSRFKNWVLRRKQVKGE
jgi:hypothetical protein